MASMALSRSSIPSLGIRDRVASYLKDSSDKDVKNLLRDVLVVLDSPFDLEWAKSEFKLSPTEYKVLSYLVEGKPAGTIAELTGTQISTVRVHIGRIYRKFNVNNSTELTAFLLQRARNI